jgi:hypothetical protein
MLFLVFSAKQTISHFLGNEKKRWERGEKKKVFFINFSEHFMLPDFIGFCNSSTNFPNFNKSQ